MQKDDAIDLALLVVSGATKKPTHSPATANASASTASHGHRRCAQ